MKRKLIGMLLAALAALSLAVPAMAADSTVAGVYNVTVESGYVSTVTVTPLDGNGVAVQSTSATVNDTQTTNFYAEAERLKLTYSGGNSGAFYLVMSLNADKTTPSAGDIVYIDQETASNSVEFTVNPSELTGGKTYYLYLSGSGTDGIKSLTKVASYSYYAPYVLGDVDGMNGITSQDASLILQCLVNRVTLTDIQRQAADVNKNSKMEANDASYILQKLVNRIGDFSEIFVTN